eukprot:14539865-Alexandrium_andersonii.AAC.1
MRSRQVRREHKNGWTCCACAAGIIMNWLRRPMSGFRTANVGLRAGARRRRHAVWFRLRAERWTRVACWRAFARSSSMGCL